MPMPTPETWVELARALAAEIHEDLGQDCSSHVEPSDTCSTCRLLHLAALVNGFEEPWILSSRELPRDVYSVVVTQAAMPWLEGHVAAHGNLELAPMPHPKGDLPSYSIVPTEEAWRRARA